jgi:hypothetical protein
MLLSSKILIVTVFVLVIGIANAGAEEVEQHYLKVTSTPNILFMSGSGFYDVGSKITLDEAPLEWQDYKFVGWKVDGMWSNQNPPTIVMNRPHDVEAVFSKSEGFGNVVIDAIPRISEVTVDGTIYLPNELPLSFNWQDSTVHSITISDVVKQNPNTRYKFDSWKDQNENTIRTITVGKDDSNLIAIYKTQHYLKPISEYGTVHGGGWQDAGSTVSFELESEIVPDKKNDNVRYVFDSWDSGDYKNSPSNLIDVEDAMTVKANWEKQYKLEIHTTVPDYNIFGTGWYGEGRVVALIAEASLESPNSDVQYVFEKWVTKGSNPVIIPNQQSPITSITVNEPYIIEAHYKNSYKVNVWTPYGSAIGSGFYPEGQIAEVKMTNNQVIVEPNKIKKVFSGWHAPGARIMDFSESEGSKLGSSVSAQNLLFLVDRPMNVTADWITQYYLDVQSREGNVEGSGWYDIGRLVPISAKTATIPAGMWSTMVFDKWTGDYDGAEQNGRVIVNKPKTVIAEWKEDRTPGIVNSIILAGVGGIAFLIYTKTKTRIPSFNGKHQIQKNEPANDFDKFFNTRQRLSSEKNTSSLISKQSRVKSILDWLLGRG